jgi:hypothetical protein
MINSIEFKIKHRIKQSSFTREVKLTFAIMMGLMIKKSSKSSQNSLNDMTLTVISIIPLPTVPIHRQEPN